MCSPTRAGLTTGDGWKLVVTGPDVRRAGGVAAAAGHRVQLFHLAEDPMEKVDLSEKEPGRVAEMGRKLVAFRGSEPREGSLPPMNRRPAGFETPGRWHIGKDE